MGKIVGRQLIRVAALLTADYVAATEADTYSAIGIVLLVAYKMGAAEAGNSVVFKVEWSDDGGTTYYQDANCLFNTASMVNGAITVDKTEYTYGADAAAEVYDYISVSVPVLGKRVKVSFKESGVAANYGTCYANLLLLEDI